MTLLDEPMLVQRYPRTIVPVIIVFILYLLARACTTASIGENTKRFGRLPTLYNRVVGTSRFEPPGVIFALAWGIIYTGLAALWAYGNWNIRDEEQLRDYNLIFVTAVVLNASWALLVGLAGVGVIDAKAAHFTSTLVLVAIVVHSAYALFLTRDFLTQESAENSKTDISKFGSGVFALLFVWAIVATFLSATSPYLY